MTAREKFEEERDIMDIVVRIVGKNPGKRPSKKALAELAEIGIPDAVAKRIFTRPRVPMSHNPILSSQIMSARKRFVLKRIRAWKKAAKTKTKNGVAIKFSVYGESVWFFVKKPSLKFAKKLKLSGYRYFPGRE